MPDRPWLPEHPVDAALAARLAHSRCPELSGVAPERVGAGWDCDVWRVGELAFRFPRRAMAVQLIEVEARALGWLAPRLPVAVPRPYRVFPPAADFRAPFWAHALVPGTTGDRMAFDEAGRLAVAPSLGAFLRALHALDPVEAARAGVPSDVYRADPPGAAARARVAMLEATRWADRLPAARALLAAAPPSARGTPVVLHGDMYARHLLFDAAGALAGVIDWGDVCLGDRALDLSIAWSFLPPAARPAFFAAYGEVDAATCARARVLALARYGVNLLAYASDVGDAVLEAEAGRALDHVLAGGAGGTTAPQA